MSAAVEGGPPSRSLGRRVAGLGPAHAGSLELHLHVAADLDAIGRERRERLAAIVHGVQGLGEALDEPQPIRG